MSTDSITALVSKPHQLAYLGLSGGVNSQGLCANQAGCDDPHMLQCCNDILGLSQILCADSPDESQQ